MNRSSALALGIGTLFALASLTSAAQEKKRLIEKWLDGEESTRPSSA